MNHSLRFVNRLSNTMIVDYWIIRKHARESGMTNGKNWERAKTRYKRIQVCRATKNKKIHPVREKIARGRNETTRNNCVSEVLGARARKFGLLKQTKNSLRQAKSVSKQSIYILNGNEHTFPCTVASKYSAFHWDFFPTNVIVAYIMWPIPRTVGEHASTFNSSSLFPSNWLGL